MIRGIFSAASGMIAQYERINVMGNNLDNADSQGFKSDAVSLRSFDEELTERTSDNAQIGTLDAGVKVGGVETDLSQGELEQTGTATNVAIEGNGFFSVAAPGEPVRYTRAGNFVPDASGYLSLPSGQRLLDSTGVPVAAAGFRLQSNGAYTNAAGQAGTIPLYTGTATKRTDGFFDLTGAQAAAGSNLLQGYVEKSNVSAVNGMTGLIEASRSFQSCQQAYNTATDTLDKLVTQVGSLR
ncbi:MAG: flagellar hook basal-body protein [Ethanoligenens sp.]